MNPYFPSPESLSLEIAWAARHDCEPGWNHFAPAVSPASLWHIEAGELSVSSDGIKQIARAGDWVWRAPSGARRMEVGLNGARWNTVGLVALCGGKNWFTPPISQIFAPTLKHESRGAQLMALLVEGHNAGVSRGENDGLARALLGWVWSVSGQNAPGEFPLWLRESLERIERAPEVSVAQLAQGAHFSPAQFRRLWEKHLGQSPRETLGRRRLEKARALLEDETLGVAAIAARSGFAGSAQLARAFRGAFGSAPLEWRRAMREKI